MSKRILIVCQHFWPESFRINDIADFFVEQGCEVDVLCGLPNYPKGEFEEGYGYFGKRHEMHNGVQIDRVLEIRRGNNSNLRIFLNYISFPFFSLFHVPKLLTRKYDHVFLYQLSPVMMSIAGIIVGKLKRIPITMYVLDLWPENLYSVIPVKNKFLRTIAEKHSHWYYKRVDRLVALSSRMQQKLAELTQKKREEILVLPQTCEKIYEQRTHDEHLRKRFSGTFNVVFTGNISPAQSFETMIEAAKILKEEEYANIRWVIVGDGMSCKDVKKKVAKEGLSDTFVFEGHHPIEDMPKYADIAGVLVGCLVKSELLEATIPAKVISYIALGKPIVLAMDGEVQELINKTIRGGIVGPAENYQTLATNIKNIYELSQIDRRNISLRLKRYYTNNLKRNVVLERLFRFVSGVQ
jgi:colanic acid biosynthesis glycosyl transferase WcaI